MAAWRLIEDFTPRPAAMQIAIDHALAEECAAGAVPALRWSTLSKTALVLGDSQPTSKIDLAAVATRGYDLTRRPTGGWAILVIAGELQYTLAGSEKDLDGYSLYVRGNAAMMAGLVSLGVEGISKLGNNLDYPEQSAKIACFDSSGGGEVLWNGRKVFASCTDQSDGYVMLQGTIPLSTGFMDVADVLSGQASKTTARTLLEAQATGIASALGVSISDRKLRLTALAAAFSAAFANEFGVKMEVSQLSAAVLERAQELVAERYGNDAWVRRV